MTKPRRDDKTEAETLENYCQMSYAYSRSISKILFASDLHGNQLQYDAVLNYACSSEIELLIFGGDLLPKSASKRTVERQYNFFSKKLLPLLERYIAKKNSLRLDLEIVFIYGNDDFKAIYQDVKKELEDVGISMLCNDVYSWKGFDIIGYSYVPVTPFKYKDWEKLDYSSGSSRHTSHTFVGYISTKNGLEAVGPNQIHSRSSIDHDLHTLFSKTRQPVIFVAHAPPRETNLDYTYGNEHVGSDAIRHAILNYQPVLSLHGHIHESAQITRTHKDRLNKTRCFTTGNFFDQKVVKVVEVAIDNYKYLNYRVIVIGGEQALAQYDERDRALARKTYYTWLSKHSDESLRHLVYVSSRSKV